MVGGLTDITMDFISFLLGLDGNFLNLCGLLYK